jgi:hypothetical protein
LHILRIPEMIEPAITSNTNDVSFYTTSEEPSSKIKQRILEYVLTQLWRAKEIFDQEGVSGPGHVIPGHKMTRLVSLFLCGDVSPVGTILPIIRRVTDGDGLDVVKVKELLRQNLDAYDDRASLQASRFDMKKSKRRHAARQWPAQGAGAKKATSTLSVLLRSTLRTINPTLYCQTTYSWTLEIR